MKSALSPLTSESRQLCLPLLFPLFTPPLSRPHINESPLARGSGGAKCSCDTAERVITNPRGAWEEAAPTPHRTKHSHAARLQHVLMPVSDLLLS